jgi:hypothetical protein
MTVELRTITQTIAIPAHRDADRTVERLLQQTAAVMDSMGLSTGPATVSMVSETEGDDDELLKVLSNAGVADRAGLFESLTAWRDSAVRRGQREAQHFTRGR